MKDIVSRPTSLIAAMAVCAFAVPRAGLAVSPSATVSPYTFMGRVMDSRHAGFDTNRVCTITACNEDGSRLAETKSIFRDDLRDNYALKIPVATAAADDHAVQGDALTIAVTDDAGRTWQGVIPDALCGAAGTIRRVDIVLGEDADGDGIDDPLYAELLDQWECSDYWRFGEEFDPRADHDNDGVPTIDEAYAGTNPFDPDDSLRITAFTTDALGFPALPGRAYSVQSATNFASGAWAPASFTIQKSGESATAISIPNSKIGAAVPVTLYLLPTDDAARFYRVRLE